MVHYFAELNVPCEAQVAAGESLYGRVQCSFILSLCTKTYLTTVPACYFA